MPPTPREDDPERSTATSPATRARTGRHPIARGAGARQRVLRAALEILDEDGLPGFTMEAIARRAAASKATLYRHWPSVGALLIDAMDATFQPFPTPDTGRVETDVAQLLGSFVTMLEHTPFPRLLAVFIDAAERDATLARLHADLTQRRREPLLAVLARARDRGQLPADVDPEVLTDLLTGPFFYRRFIAHRPIPAGLVDDVIARVLPSPTRATTARRAPARQAAPRATETEAGDQPAIETPETGRPTGPADAGRSPAPRASVSATSGPGRAPRRR